MNVSSAVMSFTLTNLTTIGEKKSTEGREGWLTCVRTPNREEGFGLLFSKIDLTKSFFLEFLTIFLFC